MGNMIDVVDAVSQVRVNIANGDMVGHTGNLDATIVGCTTTDKAIKVTPPLSWYNNKVPVV